MKALPVGVCLVLLACDLSGSQEEVAALQERVDALEAELEAAKENDAEHDDLDERVGAVEKRVATSEAELTAVAEAQKKDSAGIESVRLEVDELKIKGAKMVDGGSGTDAGGEGGDGETLELKKIGVPECDEYLEKYLKCVTEKMPPSVRGSTIDAIEQSVEAWEQAASTPAGKEALASTCKTALDAAKKAMKSIGCTF